MNVQFYNGSKRPVRSVGFLSVQEPRCVRLLCQPKDWVKVWLHWHEGRSVPCLGRECKHCVSEPRLYAYGAGVVGRWLGNDFESRAPVIVCLTDACFNLTEMDYTHLAIELRRLGGGKNGELTYKILGSCKEPTEPPFDVRSRMMNVWQIRNAQDMARLNDQAAERQDAMRKMLAATAMPAAG